MDLYGSGADIEQVNSQTAETRALNEATADFNNSLAEQLDQANLEQDEDRKQTLTKNITSGVTAGGKLKKPNDSGQLQLGASQDLQLYHNGTDSYIDNHQGDLYIRGDGDDIFLKAVDTKDSLRCIPNAAVELYHNDNKKLETTSGGVTVTGSVVCDTNFRGGDNVKLSLGDAQDLEIDHDGTNNDINYSNGNLLIRQGSHSSSQCLQFDGNGHLYVPDNELIYFGSSADLQLYHDGSNSYIKEAGTGNLNIISDNTIEIEKVNGTDIARFHPDGAVELFYDGNKKFETSSNGVRIPDDIYLGLGNSDDLNIRFLNGTGAFIQSGGNNMYIRSNLIELGDNSGNKYIKCVDGAQVELYHGVDSKKLETTSSGVSVTGTVAATSYTGDGSSLTGISVGIATTAASMSGITTVLDLSKDGFKITASGITTVDVRGGTEGNSHTLRIVNSGITTIGFSTYFLFPSGGLPNIPTASGTISLISFTVHRQGAVGIATQLLAGASVSFA